MGTFAVALAGGGVVTLGLRSRSGTAGVNAALFLSARCPLGNLLITLQDKAVLPTAAL